jgi:hypothetical protein
MFETGRPLLAPPPASPSLNQALLGAMTAKVSVKQLAQYMIDPVADDIFEAVWTDITPKGRVEHLPTTEDDWENVKTGAISLVEGVYLPTSRNPCGRVVCSRT